MEPNSFMPTGEVAQLLHISTKTLERWRVEGTGPVFRKAGRKVLYALADIETWLNANAFTSTSEAKSKGGRDE